MVNITADQWMEMLSSSFWYALIIMVICILLIYSLEMGRIAFSNPLSWEKKSWATTQPASRYFANYLDFFNQLIYHSPSSIAWKLRQQFLKTLITSREISVSPKNDDFSYVKSLKLREFLINPKKWSDKNIGSFIESLVDPYAYLEAIGVIAVPFNEIINEMRQEMGLEPVTWKAVPFKRRSYYIRKAIEIVFKGSFSVLASLIIGILASISLSRYSRPFIYDVMLVILLFMVVVFIVVYKWVANRVYIRIIEYKRKTSLKMTRLANRFFKRNRDEHKGSI